MNTTMNMNATITATTAIKILEAWLDEKSNKQFSKDLSIEDVRKAVHQILPSWKYVGWEPGLVNRRGWRKNYAQFRNKENERIGISFWEYDSYWDRT